MSYNCIMERYPNMIELMIEFQESIKRLEKKMDLLLSEKDKINLSDDFNIKGIEAAAKKLKKSESFLSKKIRMEGSKLKKEQHYRISDTGFYTFSESALKSIEGLI